jgi:hypothetical protein
MGLLVWLRRLRRGEDNREWMILWFWTFLVNFGVGMVKAGYGIIEDLIT